MMKSITSKKYPAAISAITFTCVDVIGESSNVLPTKSSMVCATLFTPGPAAWAACYAISMGAQLAGVNERAAWPAARITERTLRVVVRALVLALELQDIEASISIGQIHHALRVDEA